jgi:hypothetical protein
MRYVDTLVQPGYTLSYSEDKGYEGRAVGKPLLVVYARGGQYPAGSAAEAFDLQTRYMNQIRASWVSPTYAQWLLSRLCRAVRMLQRQSVSKLLRGSMGIERYAGNHGFRVFGHD